MVWGSRRIRRVFILDLYLCPTVLGGLIIKINRVDNYCLAAVSLIAEEPDSIGALALY
ncbi:conserved hypothetical protein [Ricinus communis]|uniref:Uncharacterized protein n=1 Tax=Ricinus communis TaxID=3988 RepID=B9SZ15_RICCO|nr:conserved hypothetical protein [Ricinus communis]